MIYESLQFIISSWDLSSSDNACCRTLHDTTGAHTHMYRTDGRERGHRLRVDSPFGDDVRRESLHALHR